MSERRKITSATDEHAASPPLPTAVGMVQRRSAQPESSPHVQKFRVATALLVGIGVAAVAIALGVAINGKGGRTGVGNWSSWHPRGHGSAGAQEIADFVAPYYRAAPADQLAVVTSVNLNDPANPLKLVLPSSGSTSGLQVLAPGHTVAYNLCGTGSRDCSIGVGAASSDRLLLLRREALELALYTFKYLGAAQNVVAILPPGHTSQTAKLTAKPPASGATTSSKPLNIALVFDRKELQPWLGRPLRATLPEELPPTVSQMRTAPEAELVSLITGHGLFQQQVEQGQDGSTLIVLNPMPPQ
jgi:hypothetical protein